MPPPTGGTGTVLAEDVPEHMGSLKHKWRKTTSLRTADDNELRENPDGLDPRVSFPADWEDWEQRAVLELERT